MDVNGYPDNQDLKTIQEWYCGDLAGLMDYVKERWKYPENWEELELTTENKIIYKISTGGWSGNEDLIEALRQNYMFWVHCWVSSRRGGHYEFEVKNDA